MPPPELVTVRAIVVLAFNATLVPLTVNEYAPAATFEATLIVAVDVMKAGLVPNVPVMPAGQLKVVSVTAPEKPFMGVTVTVELPLPPAATDAAVALSVNPGWTAGVTVKLRVTGIAGR